MNHSPFNRRDLLHVALCTLVLTVLPAANGAEPQTIRQEKDGYSLSLRVPPTLKSGEEAILLLRVERVGDKGARQTVPFARIEASVRASGIGDSKSLALTAYPGGVSGEYSLVGKFPALGVYTVSVTVIPADSDTNKPVVMEFTPVNVQVEGGKNKERSAEFSLKIDATPSQPLPGELVSLRIWVSDVAKKRVTDFEPVYDSPMHFYIVREDNSDLRHVKPVPVSAAPGSKDDGYFTLEHTFPSGGVWRLFAEVAPKDAGIQVMSARLTIPGARALPEPMMAQISPLVRQGGITLRFTRPTRLLARETDSLTLELEDGQGNAINDLQINDAALAHLYFAERDGKTFVHAVPDTRDPRNGRAGSTTLSFPVRFPKAGIYRAWLAVTRAAQPILVTFVTRVYDK